MEDVIRQKFSFPAHPVLSVLQLVDSEQNLIDDNMYPRLLRTTRTSAGRARKGVDFNDTPCDSSHLHNNAQLNISEVDAQTIDFGF